MSPCASSSDALARAGPSRTSSRVGQVSSETHVPVSHAFTQCPLTPSRTGVPRCPHGGPVIGEQEGHRPRRMCLGCGHAVTPGCEGFPLHDMTIVRRHRPVSDSEPSLSAITRRAASASAYASSAPRHEPACHDASATSLVTSDRATESRLSMRAWSNG